MDPLTFTTKTEQKYHKRYWVSLHRRLAIYHRTKKMEEFAYKNVKSGPNDDITLW